MLKRARDISAFTKCEACNKDVHLALDKACQEKRKPASVDLVRHHSAKSFTFRDLAIATQNFKELNLIGEGGFGRLFKGRLESGQVVAIKQLNRDGVQGSKEFLVEILMLIVCGLQIWLA
ncbi:hypothetical protein LUZ63_002203 [Rhynchospora breviuscula]|uniref:Protein kinase domain-containing protein n=1 Tax=Rhynchospora breviuscula TaxID=2022672 RepID=A0A9Q0CZM8_9POAL|nr:hypothetical protein LUZ63_002203 [Rhynchospora breviuscula]